MSTKYRLPRILASDGSHPVARLPKEGPRLGVMTPRQWMSQGVALQGPQDGQVEPCHQLRYEQHEVQLHGGTRVSELT